MSSSRTCPSCGAVLPARAPMGLCPTCLFGGVIVEMPADSVSNEQAVALDWLTEPAHPPRILGDYELLEAIGRGAVGVVYKARQRSLDRVVAVKLLASGTLASAELIERFRTEAAAAGSLQHPNIVAVHEVGSAEGQHYLVMDYVDGPTLASLVREGPLAASRAAQLVRMLAEAVHCAHEQGILHRDLKPSNVLLDANDQPRITDFGLAKRLDGDAQLSAVNNQLTLSGQVIGSPGFMPPEQASGQHGQIGRRSDVYGLGAILYFLLTGRAPFVGEAVTDLLREVVSGEPLSPRLLNPATPRDLQTICLKCLEKEPGGRYPTAQALAMELSRFLDGKPIQARPLGALGKAWKWCRRRPALAITGAACFLSLSLGLSGVFWQWRQAEQARRTAEEKLWQACLAQAQAQRWSGRAGRRFAGLEAIRQAAAIRPTLELRNEAIACLTLPDARVQTRLRLEREASTIGLAFDVPFERYACAFDDGSVSLRRVRDDFELKRFPAEGRTQALKLLFSPQNQLLAHVAYEEIHPHSTVWDLSRDRVLFTVPFAARSLSFSPDEQQIALAERGGTIHFHDLPTGGTEVGKVVIAGGLNHIAFDPTGERLAVSPTAGPSVVIVDVALGKVCASLTNVTGVGAMSWSPDGTWLACPSDDQRVYLWHVATGERKTLEGHVGVVTGALFNRLGDILVSFGWDNTSWFWDAKLARPLVSLPGAYLPNGFDPNDRRLAFARDGVGSGIWEVEPAHECRRLGRTAALWQGDFTAEGRVLATASGDGVRLWQVPLNRILAHLPVQEARCAIWHPNGTNLITSGVPGLQLWPVAFNSQATEARIGPPRLLSTLGQEQVRLTPDGRWVVAASSANILVLDLEGLSEPTLLTGHPQAAFVSISPGGKWFATGTWHGNFVKVWSTETWQPVKELAVAGSVRCLFSPAGRWLITGSPDEYCLWEVGSWKAGLRLPREHAGDMYGSMALAPDGRTAALLHARNRGVKLISIPDGRELAELDTGEPICFSEDGAQLATMGEDHRTLLVWDLHLIRQQLRALKLDWD